MGIALIFTMDLDRLVSFYKDPWGIFFVSFFVIINPLLFLFGFSCRIKPDEVVGTSYIFFRKNFKLSDLSHVLYQPTWRGITPMESRTNMRSLHIVRYSGGWMDTISLSNAAFREEDLADIARRLTKANPRVEIDKYVRALMSKHEGEAVEAR
jgi:hypothetical protein